ncbi:MAG: glycosyltransferase family 9 protein [bacterium]
MGNPSERRMLILNYNGLGNGIYTLLLLKRLEELREGYSYFHIQSPGFTPEITQWLGLKNCLGVVPSIWRRVRRADWDAIRSFIFDNHIDLVVNLRKEGPTRDVGYFQFKREVAPGGVEFWELEHRPLLYPTVHQHAVLDIVGMFASRGIDLTGFNRYLLRDLVASLGGLEEKRKRIGFFTGSSQTVKMWSACRWLGLGKMLLDETDFSISVYAGQTEMELSLAGEIVNQLESGSVGGRCALVAGLSLKSLCIHLGGLDLVISNDTGAVHIAAALNLPTIGLYFSTDAIIWGGFSDNFTPTQSQFGLSCPELKRDTGSCKSYYGGCSAPCGDEVTPERVFGAVKRHLQGANSLSLAAHGGGA